MTTTLPNRAEPADALIIMGAFVRRACPTVGGISFKARIPLRLLSLLPVVKVKLGMQCIIDER